MKNKKIILKIALFAMLVLFVLPVMHTAMAQTPAPATKVTDYTVLAPLPGTTNTEGCDVSNPKNPACKTTLEKYLPGVFKLAVGLAVVAAVLMIVFGGFQYMTSDALQGKSAGKERIKNAVISLVLILSAWLILYTINPKLLELNLDIKPAITVAPAETGGQISAPGVPMTTQQITASNEVKEFLDDKGIVTYRGPCTEGQTTGCVNLNGLTNATKDGLVSLKNDFGSTITITGGTEGGHSETGDHPKGSAIDFSFRYNANLGTFVENNKIGNPQQTSLGPLYTLKINGRDTTFLKESDHWHVVFK